MKRTILKSMLLAAPILASGAASNVALADGVSACRTIQWQPYEVYHIKSSLHQRTHVILPEPIQGTPVPGNPQLWDIDGENIHLFVKPKNYGNQEGERTTVTAISTTNTSYDFLVTRVKSGADVCVRIVQDNFQPEGKKHGWKTQVERENEHLETELAMMRNSIAAERGQLNERVLAGINKYKTNIYTGYKWNGSGGFLGDNSVSDVWDDGRFTYVRLRSSAKGIMQITAMVDGKEEVVDYDFDSNNNLFTISGLFPEFIMRYDDAQMTITREDSATHGS
ncbi:TrbG/VirB9 family P-type conjugative transfer protein [Methylophaga nitratireducenticrescens]|uniref:TrbG/VirB9 family P-type conjugative transfer protein n=1 Tax=Methylophaga nitratireducenticrescens TaxID=754476 RepID=UPI00146C8920|nr:TrbG/VirB9 family P-type conjugative transfer protein [Methylophaga nitratireducenticrescens]